GQAAQSDRAPVDDLRTVVDEQPVAVGKENQILPAGGIPVSAAEAVHDLIARVQLIERHRGGVEIGQLSARLHLEIESGPRELPVEIGAPAVLEDQEIGGNPDSENVEMQVADEEASGARRSEHRC